MNGEVGPGFRSDKHNLHSNSIAIFSLRMTSRDYSINSMFVFYQKRTNYSSGFFTFTI